MEKIINWLAARKAINLGIVLGYLVFVILMHASMSNLSVWIMGKMTLLWYDRLIAGIAILGFSGLLIVFVQQLQKDRSRMDLKIYLLLLTLGGIYLHSRILFVVNIEMIHSLQFGIIAVLIFPLTKRVSLTMVWATFCGYLDELYQYLVLYPERESYFDFNDIVMDQLGIGLAMLFLFSSGAIQKQLKVKFSWIAVIGVVLIILGLGGMYLLEYMVQYLNEVKPHTWLILNEGAGPGKFWREFYHSERYFHVLTPVEGVLINLGLVAMYGLIDLSALKKVSPPVNTGGA